MAETPGRTPDGDGDTCEDTPAERAAGVTQQSGDAPAAVPTPVPATGRAAPVSAVVAFTVLLAISPAAPHVSIGGTPVDVTDLPTLAATVVGLIAVLRYGLWRDFRIPRAPEAFALACMVPFCFIAAVNAGTTSSLFSGPARWALNAVVVALAYLLLRTPGDGRRMLSLVALVAAVEAAFGLVAYGLRWSGPGGFIGISITQGKIGGLPVFGRITGTTGMASTFIGGFFALALPIAVGLAMAARKGRRWPWVVSAVVILFGLIFTLSRVPIGLGAVAVVVLLLASARVRVWLPILAVGAIGFLATPLHDRMTNFKTDRAALWGDGWRMFIHNPWFGVGPGNYIAELPRYQLPGSHGPAITPHNSLLYVGAESGVFAALALAVAIGLSLRFLRTRNPAVLGPMLGLAAYMLNAMTTNLYSIPSIAIVAWMMAPSVAPILRQARATRRTAAGPADRHSREEHTPS